uniref:Uncharacterized protein n=1 Tax=Zea mays TaxID=4577 RepID=C0HGZ3_MAIZE|nr:unknown [Zea mays]
MQRNNGGTGAPSAMPTQRVWCQTLHASHATMRSPSSSCAPQTHCTSHASAPPWHRSPVSMSAPWPCTPMVSPDSAPPSITGSHLSPVMPSSDSAWKFSKKQYVSLSACSASTSSSPMDACSGTTTISPGGIGLVSSVASHGCGRHSTRNLSWSSDSSLRPHHFTQCLQSSTACAASLRAPTIARYTARRSRSASAAFGHRTAGGVFSASSSTGSSS